MDKNNTKNQCPEKSSLGISNNQYYHQIAKLSVNQLHAKEVNKFTIDFTLPNKSLINITKPLIPTLNNPDKFILVLETTLHAFTNYIHIPDIHTFYNDIFGGTCKYDKNTKHVTEYAPRLRFKFYNEGRMIYCTLPNDYDNNESHGSHSPLLFNPPFMNIIKLAPQIIAEKYKLDKTLLQKIFDNISSLFDINGLHKDEIATLLILFMSQESLGVLSYLVIKLFNLQYILSEQLSNTIYKWGTKYIIKQQNLIKGLKPIDNKLPEYKNFNLTYIIDENDQRVIIKIDIIDINGLIKSYPNFPSHEKNIPNTTMPTNPMPTNPMPTNPIHNISKNKVNFVKYL